MLNREQWEFFEESSGWREIVATVKERMHIIMLDLLSPERCNSEEKRIKFQTEYATCLWFINQPKLDALQEKPVEGREEDEDQKDRTVAPDLEPFKL